MFTNFLTSARRSVRLASCAETRSRGTALLALAGNGLGATSTPSTATATGGGTSRTLFGEQSEGVIRGDGFRRVLTRHRAVGLAIGDVRAETAVLDGHVLAGVRVLAQITQRRLGGTTATTAAVLGLREQFFGLVDIDREDLVFRGQRAVSDLPSAPVLVR